MFPVVNCLETAVPGVKCSWTRANGGLPGIVEAVIPVGDSFERGTSGFGRRFVDRWRDAQIVLGMASADEGVLTCAGGLGGP